MGDFGRPQPISRSFGYDRGTPVDRYYIENFLSGRREDIKGRVLEVGDAAYSTRFGSAVSRQDVLHVREQKGATIVADLSRPNSLPEQAFDCIILTQTLQLIYDLPQAIREVHRALRQDGVVLATVPGISSVDRGEWGATWFWSLTESSAGRLFSEIFDEWNVETEAFGNVYAATCFLHGLALEELDRKFLEIRDPAYPVTVAIRAVRR
jgi:SAM-dependent methyltransferase